MTLRALIVAALAAATLAFSAPAMAVEPHEMLDDPALEERARELSKNLRCLVCQNQSIDDSNAPLARDLRVLLRERLEAGDSNDEAMDFLVDRYGDYVLLKPPIRTETLILWLSPILLVLVGFLLARTQFRRKPTAAPAPTPLTEAERKELDRLLDDEPGDNAKAG